jgi:hypothetical protein
MRINSRSIIFLVSFSILIAVACNAQQKLKQEDVFAKQDKRKSLMVFSFPIVGHQYFATIANPLPAIKYCLPKGGIFCQMESAIHQRLNFWIKFRMGTDDRYSD